MVLIGGVLALVRPFSESNGMATASAGGEATPNATSPLSMGPGFNTNGSGPKVGPNTPDVDSSANCGAPDQGLAAALVTELPMITGTDAQAADVSCPLGSAAVAFQLTDGANAGKLELILVPPSVPNDPGTGAKPAVRVAKGNAVTVKTHNGGALTLATLPGNGSTAGPYAGDLGNIAARLAARY